MPVQITLLGPPRVRRDGQPARFDTRKAIVVRDFGSHADGLDAAGLSE